MNTWPDGKRNAITQCDHEKFNAQNHPGTRQLCVCCDEPIGRCKEDSIYLPPKDPNGPDLGPLCEECCDSYLTPNVGVIGGRSEAQRHDSIAGGCPSRLPCYIAAAREKELNHKT